jgi:hypothetical protein
MSIILDALRKAEASRRGDDRLGLATAPVRRTPLYARIPLGFVAAAATLFLSVGVGAWLLWPEGQEHAVAGSERSPAPGSMPAQAPSGAPSPGPAKSPAAEAASLAAAPAAPAAPAGAGETARAEGALTAPPPAGSSPSPKQGSPDDVRLLAMEARLAEPPAPAAAAPTRGGSVQVQDLMGAGGGADAGPENAAPPQKPTKPGSVEVRDLLAEQGVEPVAPQAPEAAGVLSEADGGIVSLPTGARPATAKPASVARSAGAPPPGAALPPHAAPPVPRAAPDVPSLDDLVASGQLNPPDLSLDMHAYGPDAAARFVYINMRRYHIGDTTREGAVVEDITPDGVVLQLQGRRFALSAR